MLAEVTGRAEEIAEETTPEAEATAEETPVTKDWVTTSPLVPVRVKGAE